MTVSSSIQSGYQITQHRVPLASGGFLEVPVDREGSDGDHLCWQVQLRRLHLEQDSGMAVYGGSRAGGLRETLIDFNRAGTSVLWQFCYFLQG